MKIPSKFTIYDLRFTIGKKSPVAVGFPRRAAVNRQSSIVNHQWEKGIALVITLIMLSVTLIMAVAFLALSRRERSAVATTTDTAVARLAADSALSAAQAQIAASVFATTNAAAYDYHLLVSTNYMPPSVGMPGDLTNLFISPRAPVLISATETNGRFYLDLNRNGTNDPNGSQPQIGSHGGFLHPDGTEDNNSANVVTNFMVGDPEWIGVLERPDQPHSANNHFVARYAFMAQPIGNSLDLNFIHNHAKSTAVTPQVNQPNPALDGFFRNQGVGSWEINLASFLADLNINQWNTNSDYSYSSNTGSPSQGKAFEDALALLNYRYGGTYTTLAAANSYFPNLLNYPFNVDVYSDGPLQVTINTNVLPMSDNTSLSWAGANNTNRFFSLPTDLFDATKSSANFVSHLTNAAAGTATYDRYTFYRLLDQLGTDSSADAGKMNLNYDNLDAAGNVVPGAETNLLAWTPLRFFTNAADRMLRTYSSNWFAANPVAYLQTYYGINASNVNADGYGLTNVPFFGWTNRVPTFGLANIPVQFNGNFVYSPAVNRVLQLAANLYDASTTNFYPSVFRPTFWVTNESGFNNVYVNGYEDVGQLVSLATGSAPLDYPITVSALPLGGVSGLNISRHNVFGVPWIIGAKKGLPAFNQFSLISEVQVTRKLEVSRPAPGVPVNQTNQMYVMSISNNLGISFWNPYYANKAAQSGSWTVFASNIVYQVLTNGGPSSPWSGVGRFIFNPPTFATWPGSQWGTYPLTASPQPASFLSTNWNFLFMPESVYRFSMANFIPTNSPSGSFWETNTPSLPPLPQFGLSTTNYLQAYILDGNHVIDYVQLRDPGSSTNITQALADPDYPGSGSLLMWSTNLHNGVGYGLINQLDASKNYTIKLATGGWGQNNSYSSNQTAKFNYYINTPTDSNTVPAQAPYTPSRKIYSGFLLQANDPLVHYLASDLNSQIGASATWASKAALANGIWQQSDDSATQPLPVPPANPTSGRYQPWGPNKQMAGLQQYVDTSAYNLAWKDPLVWSADYWDFPTNRYPTVGWIGRVHRGTPWQTVYLKATNILNWNQTSAKPNGMLTWANWTGDLQLFDATNSAPVQDRLLFDLFTTRFNDNAAHGTLSVNQANFAAWSAVFSGMVALNNNSSSPKPGITPSVTNVIVSPGGIYGTNSPLGQIYNGILAAHANTNLFPSGVFTRIGDILSVPQLAEQSPFLNLNSSGVFNQINAGISDELYEWLPQQTLGLLRCSGSPRYVLYCYGQSLRPAANSISTASQFFGLVTNYQVMAESAARAVIRFDRSVITNASGSVTGTNYTTTVESYNVLPPD